MRKNSDIIVEMTNETIKKFIEKVSLRAFADEGNTDTNTNSDDNKDDDSSKGPTINYEDLIAKARKEEKDKQYKTIEKLKTQINSLTNQHNDDLLKIAGIEEDLAKANEKLTTVGNGDSEEVKTLKETLNSLTKDKEELEKKVKHFEENKPLSREEIETSVREELEKEYEVKTYKATKMAELKDEILVPELVFGSTKEEIDNSIQQALERSAEIKKSLGVTGNKRTPKTSTNPSVSGVQDKSISLEHFASLDVRSPEYAEARKKLGLR